MSDTDSKKPGTKMRVSNPPNKNGNPNGADWENLGNIFLDPSGRRGTFYLNASADDLKKLLKGAKDGKVSRKFGIFLSKKDGGQGGGAGGESTPAAPAATAEPVQPRAALRCRPLPPQPLRPGHPP